MNALMRRRMMMAVTQESEWLYESVLTDNGDWFGARCPAIAFDVKSGEKYYIEWSNCQTSFKYVYDMRKCGGSYVLVHLTDTGDIYVASTGNIEITVPEDGTLFIGCGSSTNIVHDDIQASCFDGDYIRIKKIE